MELSDRKKRILRAIVDEYIRTAEPVGSKALANQPDIGCSSATIRNEMAELDAMGLLEQPHTSAGRIPSPAGYRLYVDELMQDYSLSLDETKSLNEGLRLKMQELDKVVTQAGKIVSQLTGLPAMAMAAPAVSRVTVRHFELFMTDPRSFIVVIQTSDDNVKNKLIRLPLECSEQDLKLLSAVLNASLTDKSVDEMTPELMSKVERAAGAASGLVSVVVNYAMDVLAEEEKGSHYVTGETRLLTHPEYQDIEKAHQLMTTLSDSTALSKLPMPDSDEPVKIIIGPENVAEELKDTSVIMARYDIGDGMQGMIGVVGPTRMDYARVAARLSYFADGLNKLFNGGSNPELPAKSQDGGGSTDYQEE